MTSSWDLYRTHAEALVWAFPVTVGDSRALRAVIGEALYTWAQTPVRTDSDHQLNMYDDAQRVAIMELLAFASGYTEVSK